MEQGCAVCHQTANISQAATQPWAGREAMGLWSVRAPLLRAWWPGGWVTAAWAQARAAARGVWGAAWEVAPTACPGSAAGEGEEEEGKWLTAAGQWSLLEDLPPWEGGQAPGASLAQPAPGGLVCEPGGRRGGRPCHSGGQRRAGVLSAPALGAQVLRGGRRPAPA